MEEAYIEKPALKKEPNLKDYNATYKGFSYDTIKAELEYYEDGKINIAHNVIDRHMKTDVRNKTALIWEDNGEKKDITYEEVYKETNKVANMLVNLGVNKGDRVFLFLPRIPELYISFLGTVKTGAIAGTLFAAFGPTAIEQRVGDAEAKIVMTTKKLKPRVLEIMGNVPSIEHLIIVDEDDVSGKELSYKKLMSDASDSFETAHMDEDDPAFMLYTSGTTGKSKGVIHVHKAILHEYMTAKYALDIKPDDVYWCTADPGWVTGIAYGIIGPWSLGTTQVVYEGRFSAEKWYQIIQEYKVTAWYTAPTAVRLLMKEGDLHKKYDLSSLRYGCSVGEPLNPEAVRWSLKEFKLPFHDNYWQTETGGIVIANYPSLPIKPGSMGKPVPGVYAAVVDEEGKELPVEEEGRLVLKPGWPSMMQHIWKDDDKYKSYFENGWYITGDKAHKDKDGYFWFVGRADDVINTAGHRVGPFEVESALVEHPAIAEAGVIGIPDELLGEKIKAFVVLNPGHDDTPELEEDIKKFIKKHLAGHAYPKAMEFVDKLPKTRSGKIMRRLLKAKELGQPLGDTTTLSNE
ncbi:MAG: acetate--CoA ligase [Candidatus Nanoarchaeia archaeon]